MCTETGCTACHGVACSSSPGEGKTKATTTLGYATPRHATLRSLSKSSPAQAALARGRETSSCMLHERTHTYPLPSPPTHTHDQTPRSHPTPERHARKQTNVIGAFTSQYPQLPTCSPHSPLPSGFSTCPSVIASWAGSFVPVSANQMAFWFADFR